jgi:hypothetical protein
VYEEVEYLTCSKAYEYQQVQASGDHGSASSNVYFVIALRDTVLYADGSLWEVVSKVATNDVFPVLFGRARHRPRFPDAGGTLVTSAKVRGFRASRVHARHGVRAKGWSSKSLRMNL